MTTHNRSPSSPSSPSNGNGHTPPSPPQTIGALLQRARGLAGRTLGDLALAEGTPAPAPENLRRHKGWVGQLLERHLGASADNRPVPDFERLGIELKTLPVDLQGKPFETTYVTAVPLTDLEDLHWKTSKVYLKLRHVLWVPVEADRAVPLADRRVGQAILWQPSPEEEQPLRQDWEVHMCRIRDGNVADITAHDGQVLQIRPKAADSHQRTWGTGEDESVIRTRPRGFYLRTHFTEYIIRKYFFEA